MIIRLVSQVLAMKNFWICLLQLRKFTSETKFLNPKLKGWTPVKRRPGKCGGFWAISPYFSRTIFNPVVNKPVVIIPSKVIVFVYMISLIKERGRTYVRTLFELIFQTYAVDRQPLFCTFCARAQNVSKQSCHLGPSGPNGKIREKISNELKQ